MKEEEGKEVPEEATQKREEPTRIREVSVNNERISYFGPLLGDSEESTGKQAPIRREERDLAVRENQENEEKRVEEKSAQVKVDKVVSINVVEEIAPDFLQMKEMKTEIRRIGRLITV